MGRALKKSSGLFRRCAVDDPARGSSMDQNRPGKEEFVDGASPANNFVREVWTEGGEIWRDLRPLHDFIKYLISVGISETCGEMEPCYNHLDEQEYLTRFA